MIGVEVGDGAIEFEGVGNQWKLAIKVATVANAPPELARADGFFRGARLLPEQVAGPGIKVGQYAVAIQK